MGNNKIAIEEKGIKKALNRYDIYKSIAEYIWNGFDANSKIVNIDISFNELKGIKSITVQDFGEGICKEHLLEKFKPFYESNKSGDIKHNSIIHGTNGIGRLTFFTFADNAKWETTYKKNESYYTYEINIMAKKLNEFKDSDVTQSKVEVTGTKVTFTNILNNIDFSIQELQSYLSLEFAWYLELNENYLINLNNTPLLYGHLIEKIDKQELKIKDEHFSIKYYCWKEKLHDEYSKYYFINSKGKELFKETTKLNNKGDKFYHSVFIKSSYFDIFVNKKNNLNEQESCIPSQTDKVYIELLNNINNHLWDMRNPFIKKYTKKLINKLEKDQAYPNLDESKILDKFRKETLDEMISSIYQIQPKIFSNLNKMQQATLIRLFDLSIQSGEIDSLYNIIESVIDMNEAERQELSSLLRYTNMSNITKTISLIKDRQESIIKLKSLVFDNSKFINETNFIQPFIEKNYWLFGEQYHLVTAEEPDFIEALRRFTYILKGEKLTRKKS